MTASPDKDGNGQENVGLSNLIRCVHGLQQQPALQQDSIKVLQDLQLKLPSPDQIPILQVLDNLQLKLPSPDQIPILKAMQSLQDVLASVEQAPIFKLVQNLKDQLSDIEPAPTLKALRGLQEQLSAWEPTPLLTNLRETSQAVKETMDAIKEIQMNFKKGLNALPTVERYNGDSIKIPEEIHNFAENSMPKTQEIIKNSDFKYLEKRVEIGLEAHKNERWELSVFITSSSIDGILTSCYRKDNDSTGIPTFKQKFDTFVENHTNDLLFPGSELRDKLDVFAEYRHEIMHGGKNAYFDINISTFTLLLLSLICHSIELASEVETIIRGDSPANI